MMVRNVQRPGCRWLAVTGTTATKHLHSAHHVAHTCRALFVSCLTHLILTTAPSGRFTEVKQLVQVYTEEAGFKSRQAGFLVLWPFAPPHCLCFQMTGWHARVSKEAAGVVSGRYVSAGLWDLSWLCSYTQTSNLSLIKFLITVSALTTSGQKTI